MIPVTSMFRLVNLRFSCVPNTFFHKGDLVAAQNIQKGECIRTPAPEQIHRTKEEQKEIDRLVDMVYRHIMK